MTVQNIDVLDETRQRINSWGALNPNRLKYIWQFAGNRVLDVGCATGKYVNLLNERGYDATGIDLLPYDSWHDGDVVGDGIGDRPDQRPLNRRFLVGGLPALSVEDNFCETALCFEVLEHVPNIDTNLQELRRICSKNVILSIPNCESHDVYPTSGLALHHWVDRTHINFFTQDQLHKKLKENGFQVELVHRINPIRAETLLLSSYHIPLSVARLVGSLATRLPFKKQFYMTLLAVASKV